jgi:ParB family chromosome partitioning protein
MRNDAEKSKVDNFLKSRLQNRAKGSEEKKNNPQEIKLSKLVDNPYQPRLEYDEKELNELALTIKENGLLQPISVVKKDDHYIIIAGHRRKRAFELLKKEKIPVNIAEKILDSDLRILAAIENLTRVDLSLIEEAKAYSDIIASGVKIKELAKKIGKSESDISRKRKLLKLNEEILRDIRENSSTIDVIALTLLRKFEDEKKQLEVYFEFLKNDRAWLKNEVKKLQNKTIALPSPKSLLVKENQITIDTKNIDKKTIDKVLKFLNRELSSF